MGSRSCNGSYGSIMLRARPTNDRASWKFLHVLESAWHVRSTAAHTGGMDVDLTRSEPEPQAN